MTIEQQTELENRLLTVINDELEKDKAKEYCDYHKITALFAMVIEINKFARRTI